MSGFKNRQNVTMLGLVIFGLSKSKSGKMAGVKSVYVTLSSVRLSVNPCKKASNIPDKFEF